MENLKGKKNIKLYHGSDVIVGQPEYGKGKLNNDYGRGFYCTEDINLAREWACAKNNDGYVNMYELDMSEMNILNLNSSKYNILNWLAVLTDNRTYWQNGSVAEEAKRYLREHFLIDISDYDVIIGYRADDSYFCVCTGFCGRCYIASEIIGSYEVWKAWGADCIKKSESISDDKIYRK